ncbi:hypothetical protein Hdeb2414_s0014g00424831 [Helianthus debilis subsp. tardiflorus]
MLISTTIQYHISDGTPKEALLLYNHIRRNPLCMLTISPLILKVCASFSMIHYGKVVHYKSIKAGRILMSWWKHHALYRKCIKKCKYTFFWQWVSGKIMNYIISVYIYNFYGCSLW